MNALFNQFKRPLIHIALATAISGSLFATSVTSPSVSRAANESRTITTVGDGVSDSPPTSAQMVLGVEIANHSLASAQSDASSRVDAIIRQLRAPGIRQDDIRTLMFAIYPVHPPAEAQSTTSRGFRVEHLLEVRMRDLGTVGGLIDSALASGTTRVDGV